ncbi:unannotated protein [freshwater metagenome]|uniref:Unannotated protein n=1 Tax=freshwater metagenome TaxID=449393 RepID=A0A6J6F0S9_9ZZZZ
MDCSQANHQQRERPTQVLVENITKHVGVGDGPGALTREERGLAHHDADRAEQSKDRTNANKRNNPPTILSAIVNEGQEKRDTCGDERGEVHDEARNAADDFPKPIAA